MNDIQNPETNDEEYLPAPLSDIPLQVILPFPVFIKVAEKMTCFRNVGDTITEARVKALEEKIDTVFIPNTAWKSFLVLLENNLYVGKEDAVKSAKNIHALLTAYSKLMEQMQEVQRGTVGKLRTLAYELVDVAKGNLQITQKLLRKYKEGSIYFANHNVNVSLYGLAIGQKIGLTIDEIKTLVFASLVHNIGYALIPHSILYKTGKLTTEEWDILKCHSKHGAELLEYMNVPTEVATVARQHHENLNGKGYPDGISGNEIHLFSRICAIADVYDALTSQKPYGPAPRTPKEAISAMQEMEGKFDPDILSRFGNA